MSQERFWDVELNTNYSLNVSGAFRELSEFYRRLEVLCGSDCVSRGFQGRVFRSFKRHFRVSGDSEAFRMTSGVFPGISEDIRTFLGKLEP